VVEFDEFIKLMEERIDTRTMGPDQKDMFREAFKVNIFRLSPSG
jgi:hypothetical protein